MQIPIASSLYYTTVVIRRPEFWGPNFYSLFLSISSVSWNHNQKWYRPQELQHNNESVIQHLLYQCIRIIQNSSFITLLRFEESSISEVLVCKYTNQKKVDLCTNSDLDWSLIYSGKKYCILIGRFDATFFQSLTRLYCISALISESTILLNWLES